MRVSEQQDPFEAEVHAKLFDIGNVVFDPISVWVRRPVGGARSPRIEHDQVELLKKSRQVAEIRGREPWAARVTDKQRSGPYAPIGELASVGCHELHVR
jgi:hypothetical protein